ncbi:hypothetical protein CRP01_16440 [Flavilitoribacter nigricans DSM 23189 = NBRC 102662]|uniref:Uncharacterized protein n=2 Tax=Flavilitoribacter TaxID=2762562 RepID=A0A2D0NAR9_FLAN2|nr:hypothetical protein CRP01_16440 [Flavilitoribacter nigricans DSM 23189 = NBRC 102662]
MRYFLLFSLFFTLFLTDSSAQKVIQIEHYGRAKTDKIFIGEGIEYRLKGSKTWRYAVVEGINIEQNLIILADRYLEPDKIDAFRYYRSYSQKLGIQVMTFGVAWSGFALIGTAVDGDPETSYRLSDGIVTASALATGFGITQLLKYKKIKFGKRKRLRLVDITF